MEVEMGVVPKVRGCVGGQLGWCLGPRACRLCCSSIAPAAESSTTRLLYLLLLGGGASLMAAMLTKEVQHNLQSAFKDFNATCIDLNISDNCMLLTGYMALYKVSFGISMFFIGLALLSVGVTSSTGVRASIHNGFWAWKGLLLCLLCVTTFVIPVPHLDSFHTGWLYCALGGACVFLLVQMVLVADLARYISLPTPSACPPLSQSGRCARLATTLISSLCLTLCWLLGYAWLFIRYTGPSCMSTNTIIVTCNAALSLLVTALTLLPCTRRSTGGLPPAALQASLVCCYLAYLTWCTVTSTPDSEAAGRDPTEEYFNAQGIQVDIGPYHAGLDPYHDLDLPKLHEEEVGGQCSGGEGEEAVAKKWVPYTASLLMFLLLCHSSVTSWSSRPASQQVLGMKAEAEEDSDPGLCICCRPQPRPQAFPPSTPAQLQEEDGGQFILRNERLQTVYSYSLFHVTLCLANMYVTMQLTQWFQPQEATIISFTKSWSTVILKTVSTWLSVLVYLATLVLPVWRPPTRPGGNTGSGQIPADLWASEETACLQTSHI